MILLHACINTIQLLQLFECLEVKELKHKLRLMEKDLEIQHSLVTDYEGEIERLSEERSDLSE